MPAYDYHCETNGRTIEVSHAMTTLLQTQLVLAFLLSVATMVGAAAWIVRSAR